MPRSGAAPDGVMDSTTTGRVRPAGISAGTLAFAGAWFVGTAIARLTGAAAVLLVLAAGLVALGAAALSSLLSTRSVTSARLSGAGVASRPVEIGLLVALGLFAVGTVRSVANLVRRRRRGRWGVLQDRFNEMTPPSATTNPLRAASFNDATQATTPANGAANDVARLLDRAAFDPEWVDDDEMYRRTREHIDLLL